MVNQDTSLFILNALQLHTTALVAVTLDHAHASNKSKVFALSSCNDGLKCILLQHVAEAMMIPNGKQISQMRSSIFRFKDSCTLVYDTGIRIESSMFQRNPWFETACLAGRTLVQSSLERRLHPRVRYQEKKQVTRLELRRLLLLRFVSRSGASLSKFLGFECHATQHSFRTSLQPTLQAVTECIQRVSRKPARHDDEFTSVDAHCRPLERGSVDLHQHAYICNAKLMRNSDVVDWIGLGRNTEILDESIFHLSWRARILAFSLTTKLLLPTYRVYFRRQTLMPTSACRRRVKLAGHAAWRRPARNH